MYQIIYQMLKDFAGPIAAIVASCAAAYFANQQRVIAQKKLEHDIFFKEHERRLALYEVTRNFLHDACVGEISEDEIKSYGFQALDAKFLFNDELYRYLREIRDRVAIYRDAGKRSAEEPPQSDEKRAFENTRSEQLKWIIQQGDEFTGFQAKFISFLKYEKIQHACWIFRSR